MNIILYFYHGCSKALIKVTRNAVNMQ